MKLILPLDHSASLSNLKGISPPRRISMGSLIPAHSIAAFASFARATTRSRGKAALFLCAVAVLLAGGTAAVRGQSALDGFDPFANGDLNVVIVQSDGKI